MTVYAAPGTPGVKLAFKARYDNFIGGRFTPPVDRQYFDVITPISGKVYTQAARSTVASIELALDAAHAAKAGWAATPAAARANIRTTCPIRSTISSVNSRCATCMQQA